MSRDDFAQLAFDPAASVCATELRVDRLTLRGVLGDALLLLQLGDLPFEIVGALVNDRAELRRLALQLLLRQRLQPFTVAR